MAVANYNEFVTLSLWVQPEDIVLNYCLVIIFEVYLLFLA